MEIKPFEIYRNLSLVLSLISNISPFLTALLFFFLLGEFQSLHNRKMDLSARFLILLNVCTPFIKQWFTSISSRLLLTPLSSFFRLTGGSYENEYFMVQAFFTFLISLAVLIPKCIWYREIRKYLSGCNWFWPVFLVGKLFVLITVFLCNFLAITGTETHTAVLVVLARLTMLLSHGIDVLEMIYFIFLYGKAKETPFSSVTDS